MQPGDLVEITVDDRTYGLLAGDRGRVRSAGTSHAVVAFESRGFLSAILSAYLHPVSAVEQLADLA